ncbi:type II secretion system protein GspM [Bradyrhizobium cenepequi]
MNASTRSFKAISTSPFVAAATYIGLLMLLLFVTVSSVSDFIGQRNELAASSAMLAQLEGRTPRAGGAPGESMPAGSAYLEGATVTVAGATLLQRVAGSVTKFGGNVLSTQLDVPNTPAKAGFISMVASCEIEQQRLQQVLYDLEAGMPFLFIDQLVVQTIRDGANAEESPGRLRVLLGVSGQWRGAK